MMMMMMMMMCLRHVNTAREHGGPLTRVCKHRYSVYRPLVYKVHVHHVLCINFITRPLPTFAGLVDRSIIPERKRATRVFCTTAKRV